MTYHSIPRVVSPYPIGYDFAPGERIPVRARDDLDPYSPPLEYADGRVMWDGVFRSREQRDAAREQRQTREDADARQERIQRAENLVFTLEIQVRNARPCDHRHTTEISTTGFVGPIPDTEQNRAAHGCVTITEECDACGARRSRNQNQRHIEMGPWSRDTRLTRRLDEARRRSAEVAS